MAFINTTPIPPEPVPVSSTFPEDTTTAPPTVSSNPAIARLLARPEIGQYKREMITWRTPHLGYVQMYINPQQMQIEDRKIVSADRTKGGYLIQYAGEALTEISIQGTTGSSGIEGINILRSVYRSEQEAFEGIAIGLEEALANVQLNELIASFTEQTPIANINIFQVLNDVFRNFGRPQPTLASLAANIELFFQGELYRGFFKNFTVTERASEPGWFDYSIGFTAYARQGKRRNFMPWHRQPINPADVNANPLSFTGVSDILNTTLSVPPSPNTRTGGFALDQLPQDPVASFTEIKGFGRDLKTAASKGVNIRGTKIGNN